MALHPSFPTSPYEPLIPEHRWFPAAETLRDGKADFYPNIDDGIEAYMEYTRLQRKKDLPKQNPEFIERRLAKKVAAKIARRLAKKQLKQQPDEPLPPN